MTGNNLTQPGEVAQFQDQNGNCEHLSPESVAEDLIEGKVIEEQVASREDVSFITGDRLMTVPVRGASGDPYLVMCGIASQFLETDASGILSNVTAFTNQGDLYWLGHCISTQVESAEPSAAELLQIAIESDRKPILVLTPEKPVWQYLAEIKHQILAANEFDPAFNQRLAALFPDVGVELNVRLDAKRQEYGQHGVEYIFCSNSSSRIFNFTFPNNFAFRHEVEEVRYVSLSLERHTGSDETDLIALYNQLDAGGLANWQRLMLQSVQAVQKLIYDPNNLVKRGYENGE